jgi:hypothetical protein
MAVIRNKHTGVLLGVPRNHPALLDDRNWEVVTLEDVDVSEIVVATPEVDDTVPVDGAEPIDSARGRKRGR